MIRPKCADCGRELKLVAKGLCAVCYQRQRMRKLKGEAETPAGGDHGATPPEQPRKKILMAMDDQTGEFSVEVVPATEPVNTGAESPVDQLADVAIENEPVQEVGMAQEAGGGDKPRDYMLKVRIPARDAELLEHLRARARVKRRPVSVEALVLIETVLGGEQWTTE